MIKQTVETLAALLVEAQKVFCKGDGTFGSSDFEKGMSFQDSYARQLTKTLGFPERELSNLFAMAKVEHTKYEEASNVGGLYGDPDWAKWYAAFVLPYLQQPQTPASYDQFDSAQASV